MTRSYSLQRRESLARRFTEASVPHSLTSSPSVSLMCILERYLNHLPVKHIPDWVPGAGFQRKAKEFKAAVLRMKNEPWDECIRRTVS